MFGDEMIDEASRKMAEQLSIKGRLCGLDKKLAEKNSGGAAAPEPAPAGATAGEQA
jgi:hypothetical protein